MLAQLPSEGPFRLATLLEVGSVFLNIGHRKILSLSGTLAFHRPLATSSVGPLVSLASSDLTENWREAVRCPDTESTTLQRLMWANLLQQHIPPGAFIRCELTPECNVRRGRAKGLGHQNVGFTARENRPWKSFKVDLDRSKNQTKNGSTSRF